MMLQLSAHVRRRMSERGVRLRDIEHALANYTSSWPTPEGSIQYIGPSPEGRDLKVWLVAPGLSEPRPIVKSTAWKDT